MLKNTSRAARGEESVGSGVRGAVSGARVAVPPLLGDWDCVPPPLLPFPQAETISAPATAIATRLIWNLSSSALDRLAADFDSSLGGSGRRHVNREFIRASNRIQMGSPPPLCGGGEEGDDPQPIPSGH